MVPSKYAVAKNTQDYEAPETRYHSEFLQGANWIDAGMISGRSGRGRAARGRPRGRTTSVSKSQKRVIGSRSETGKRSSAVNSESLEQALKWKGQPRARAGHKRGRRSIRKKQKPARKVANVVERNAPKQIIIKQPTRRLVRDEWNGFETRRLEAEIPSSSDEDDDENGQAMGDEYDDQAVDDYASGFNGKSDELLEGSDDNMNGAEDDDDDDVEGDEGEDGAGVEQGVLDGEEYVNGESDEEGMRDEDQNGDPDEVMGSTSSEYSKIDSEASA